MACGSGSVSILWYFFLCSFHLPPSLNLTGQVGTVRSNYPTLFELDCMIHVQVWLFYTQDWQLMVPSNGRNSLMVLLPNTKWPMGRAVVWISEMPVNLVQISWNVEKITENMHFPTRWIEQNFLKSGNFLKTAISGIGPTDVAYQFQKFLSQVKIPASFP